MTKKPKRDIMISIIPKGGIMFKSVNSAFASLVGFFGRFSKRQKIVFASILIALFASLGFASYTSANNVVLDGPRDCNSNSILYCGGMTTGEIKNKYYGSPAAQQVYKYFGIDQVDINNLHTTAQAGRVYKDGRVVVNGQVVATNATSAGWNAIPGSTPTTFNGVTFRVSPNSASFVSDSISAFVVMDNGAFAFAILSSCGNPVVGQAGTPAYHLDKTVKKTGGDWVKSAAVHYGEVYEYKVEVTSTGTGVVKWITTKDVLPADQKVIPGSLTLNGQYLPESHLFVEGSFINRLGPGKKLTYIFKATTAQATQPEPCTNKQSVNTANTTALLLPNQTSQASVTLTCKPAPEHPDYSIMKQVQTIGSKEWLESVNVPSGTTVRYRVVVTSNGKTPVNNVIVKDKLPTGVTYKAGTLMRDNKAVSEADKFFSTGINIGSLNPGVSTTFSFEAVAGTADQAKCKEGTMTNIASITGDKLPAKEDGANVSVTCKPAVKLSCDSLQAISLGHRNFQFKVTYTATENAKFQSASYNFGDGSSILVTDKTTVEHKYAKDGVYHASVELTFMVDGKQQKVTSENCKTSLEASTPPEMCTIPGKQDLLANDPNCTTSIVTPIAPPTVIPSTGPASMIALFAGTSLVSMFAHRIWIARRQS